MQISKFWTGSERKERKDFTGVGGLKLAYKAFPVEQGQDERAAIVISSGRTEGMVKYHEFVYDLHRLGFAVYIHDHRGQGFSDPVVAKPQMGHVEDFDDYVSDLKTFVDDVVKQNNHQNLFLVAHSMGGAIASLYLEKHVADFSAAVLSSPMHEPDILGPGTQAACLAVKGAAAAEDALRLMNGKPPNYARNMGPYSPVSFEENELTHSKVRYRRLLDEFEANEATKIGGPSKRWVAAACRAGWNARKNAGDVQTQVLVLQAGGDTIVKANAQNEFCRKTEEKCVGGTPHVIEDALHELFIECDQYRIPALTKMLEFLDSQL